jgi:DNA-binding NarL/FixJ family response regulator
MTQHETASYEVTDQIYDALAGATGYLLKETPRAELVSALQEVHDAAKPIA